MHLCLYYRTDRNPKKDTINWVSKSDGDFSLKVAKKAHGSIDEVAQRYETLFKIIRETKSLKLVGAKRAKILLTEKKIAF